MVMQIKLIVVVVVVRNLVLQAMCWFSCFEYSAKPAYLKICNRKFKKPVLQTFLRTKGYQQ